MRRIPWTVLGAYLPLLAGVNTAALLSPPAPVLALLCATMPASLLLDIAHAAWAYARVGGRGPQTRRLWPGSGARVRDAQTILRVCLVVMAVLGLMLASRPAFHLADPAVDPTGDTATGPLPTRLLALLSALAVTALALLLIRPVTTARRAIYYDTVHRPTLDTAARTMRRVGLLGIVPAGLLVASVLSTPGAALLAAAPIIPLTICLGGAATQLASYTGINVADPQTLNRRRIGGRTAATRP